MFIVREKTPEYPLPPLLRNLPCRHAKGSHRDDDRKLADFSFLGPQLERFPAPSKATMFCQLRSAALKDEQSHPFAKVLPHPLIVFCSSCPPRSRCLLLNSIPLGTLRTAGRSTDTPPSAAPRDNDLPTVGLNMSSSEEYVKMLLFSPLHVPLPLRNLLTVFLVPTDFSHSRRNGRSPL